MRRDARMLAALLGRSMGLGEAWEVSGTWSGEVEGGPDELRAGVARRRGHAVPCPECGVPCGARDARGRTWRHLDIWQFRTYARCAVPRTDCPEHGAGTVPVPWEVRPNSHLAALLGDRALAARVRGSRRPSGTTAGPGTCSGARSRRPGGRPITRTPGASAQARPAARRATPTHPPCPAPAAGGAHGAADGGDWAPRPARAAGPEAHGRDRAAIAEVTRDMSGSLSPASRGRCRRRRRPQAAPASRGSSRGRRTG